MHYVNSRAMAMTLAMQTVDEELARRQRRARARRAERRYLRDRRRADRRAAREATAVRPGRRRVAQVLHLAR